MGKTGLSPVSANACLLVAGCVLRVVTVVAGCGAGAGAAGSGAGVGAGLAVHATLASAVALMPSMFSKVAVAVFATLPRVASSSVTL